MIELLNGDCIERMKQLPDNSVDAVVTDPPYGLRFMGKHWDYDVPNVDVWREVYRVLKPGGYLLSFGGTRTYHRMACAIEDAGFEIRDMVEWLYGSGFPKSLDIGKAVDKLRGNEREITGERRVTESDLGQKSGWNYLDTSSGKYVYTKGTSEWEGWGTALKPAHESICVAQKRVQSSSDYEDYFVSLLKQIKRELCQYQSFAQTAERNLRLNPKGSRGVVDIAQWLAEENINIQEDLSVLTATLQSESEINSSWSIVLSWLNTLADLSSMMNTYTTLTELRMTTELSILNSLEWGSIFQNITQAPSSNPDGSYASVCIVEDILSVVGLKLNDIRTRFVQGDVTSMEDKRASAPNIEPICMARKPLSEKTVAENVLKHGTGGINIEGCRVESEPIKTGNGKVSTNEIYGKYKDRDSAWENNRGRFPANVIHDGSEVVAREFPNGGAAAPVSRGMNGKSKGIYGDFAQKGDDGATFYNDNGSAARFFYCAKASKSERNYGLEDFEFTRHADRIKEDGSGGENPRNRTNTEKQNYHPTVKPVALMRYLCRMVTPKGGTILDPFMGSGTTGIAAKVEGYSFIGIEREEGYCKIAEARIAGWEEEKPEVDLQQKLF